MFALWYHVDPEGRKVLNAIMWEFRARLFFAVLGWILAYILIRRRIVARSAEGATGWLRSGSEVPLAFCLGLLPGVGLWWLWENMVGGYFFLEAWEINAPREIALGIVGMAGWSLFVGMALLTLCRRVGQPFSVTVHDSAAQK